MKKNLLSAAICINANGKHTLIDCSDDIYIAKCENCGERFVLVSETAFKKINVTPVERNLINLN